MSWVSMPQWLHCPHGVAGAVLSLGFAIGHLIQDTRFFPEPGHQVLKLGEGGFLDSVDLA